MYGSIGELVILCPPSLSGRSSDYLPSHLGTNFFRTAISDDRGCRHLLVYIDDYKRLKYFKLSPTQAWLHLRGLEVATSFAHGMLAKDVGGRWC
jgi:hypothetical protein